MSIWNYANPQLKDLVAYEPGKPIEDVARERGLKPEDIIKLASNENPLGPSPKAVVAMKKAVEEVHIYPDGASWKLRNALAEKFGLEMGNFIMGCGSNEVIEFIGHAFLKPGDNIVTAEHAFLVYKLMAKVFGADTIEVPDPGYVHDLDAMAAAITPRTKEVFIANPNNPTGTLVSQKQIDRFMDMVPEHVVVVFDEAYHEFLDDPPDTLKFVRAGRNVVVLRTFSKIQGLAGTRVGYGVANKELIDVLQRTRQPFNLNSIAQAGALAGLLDAEHQARTKRITDEGRAYLQEEFGAMGLEFIPSCANFVLVKVGDGNEVFRKMMDKGVIVRAMAAYKLPGWVRISVGTMEQCRRCVEVLRSVLGNG
ncbi:MAG: histidinol-phosphate transaminase [Verrucomicrobiaceae bacterium]|nr:histidinol-phosphate transaminase [Verrucomicrobiaceae bacterium]